MKESSLIKMQKELKELQMFCVIILGRIEKLEKKELFIRWIKYKKEKKSNYTESGINQLLVDWGNKSNEELEKAINNSISNNYQGLFEPKQQIENGNTTEKLGTSAARMEALRKW